MSVVDIVQQKGFHCAHMNIRSLFNKVDLVSQLVDDCKERLHVLGLSETWLSNGIPDDFVSIKGYQTIRLDRSWGDPNIDGNIKRGGGICLFINEHITWVDQKYKHLNRSSSVLEIQWIEIINPKSKNIVIGNGYRPPDGNVTDFIAYFENSLNNIDFTKNVVFLIGDFNIDYLDKLSENTKQLKSLLKEFGLNQMITTPTRFSNVKNSCLDLICTNSDDISNVVVCVYYGCVLSLVRLPCGAGGSPASLIETQKLLLSRGL